MVSCNLFYITLLVNTLLLLVDYGNAYSHHWLQKKTFKRKRTPLRFGVRLVKPTTETNVLKTVLHANYAQPTPYNSQKSNKKSPRSMPTTQSMNEQVNTNASFSENSESMHSQDGQHHKHNKKHHRHNHHHNKDHSTEQQERDRKDLNIRVMSSILISMLKDRLRI